MNTAEEIATIVRRIRREGHLPNAMLVGNEKLTQLRQSKDLRMNPDQRMGNIGYLKGLPSVQIFHHPQAGPYLRFYETEITAGMISDALLDRRPVATLDATPISADTFGIAYA